MAAIVLFLLATDSSAGVKEDAIAAHKRKDFAEVLRLLHVLADENNSWGMLEPVVSSGTSTRRFTLYERFLTSLTVKRVYPRSSSCDSSKVG
jgi:hypothetical protein